MKEQQTEKEITILDKNNNVKKDTDILATTDKMQVTEENKTTEYTLIVTGETITLTFTGGGKNSNNVAADLNKVANFKLKIKND